MRSARSFWRDRDGASALEFALLVPVLFALVLSALESGWIMTERMLLDRALDQTVRLLRVGATSAPKTQQEMKQTVCKAAMIVPDCLNVITIEMTQVTKAVDFPSTGATCVDRSKKVQPTVSFTAGSRSSIMYVRACLIVDPFTPGLGLGLALQKDASGGYGLVSVGAFMNEPSS